MRLHSDGSDAAQGEGVLATRTSDPTTVTAGASVRMTRHLATSTPDRAATRVGGYGTTGRDQQPRLEDIETSEQIVGQRVHQPEKDPDRDNDGKHRSDSGDRGPAFDEICRDTQSRTGRDDAGDDQHLDVAPDWCSIAVSLEDLPRRHEEIDPPHAEGESHARDAGQHRIQRAALPVDHS